MQTNEIQTSAATGAATQGAPRKLKKTPAIHVSRSQAPAGKAKGAKPPATAEKAVGSKKAVASKSAAAARSAVAKNGAAGKAIEPKKHALEKKKDTVLKDEKKKKKVVRDSFTMPESDYQHIADLKRKCLEQGVPVKKSELLRAGLQALSAMPIKQLLGVVAAVENLKTGRPGKAQ